MTWWFVVFCRFVRFLSIFVVLCRFLSFWGACFYMIVFVLKSKINTSRRRHSFFSFSLCMLYVVCMRWKCMWWPMHRRVVHAVYSQLICVTCPGHMLYEFLCVTHAFGLLSFHNSIVLCFRSVCVRMSAEARLGSPPSTSVPVYNYILYICV